MKNLSCTIIFSISLLLRLSSSFAQPIWANTIGLANDSTAKLIPVKVLVDNTDQIYVLMQYNKFIAPSTNINKIYLKKMDENGLVLWTYIFDNNGVGNPRGYDMALDGSNNVYIAGGLNDGPNYGDVFLKVTSTGAFDFVRIGNSSFNVDWYTEIKFRNNLFYLRGNPGVVVYDQNGLEQYVINEFNAAFDVDYSGRVVIAGYFSTSSLKRFDSTGALDFADSTIYADKVLCDYSGEIYLTAGIGGFQSYEVVKYNSNGQFEWLLNNIGLTPPFGDFNYGILDNGQNGLILYGIGDSIIKFNPQGQIIWRKSSNGMEEFISGKITGNGFILLTGTMNGFAGADVVTKMFNINGTEVWNEIYSGVVGGNESSKDVDAGYSGIYVISGLEDSTNVMKYINPNSGMSNVDFNLVCVDSVYIDTAGMVNITIFNGNFVNMNYPGVMIISPAGDTISTGTLSFFAQLGNSYQTYLNTISDTSITDFSNYTFMMGNSFNPDTFAQIEFCLPTSISNLGDRKLTLYPNPADEELNILWGENIPEEWRIIDLFGKEIMHSDVENSNRTSISTSQLSEGVYFIRTVDGSKFEYHKFMIVH